MKRTFFRVGREGRKGHIVDHLASFFFCLVFRAGMDAWLGLISNLWDIWDWGGGGSWRGLALDVILGCDNLTEGYKRSTK